MSEPVLLSRSIGFRARLEARVSWLLEPVKRELAASMLPLFIASLTTERLVEPIERHVTRLTRALVEGKAMQQAVLDRAWLAENWSLSDCDTSDPDLEAALAEAALFEQRAGRAAPPPVWPSNVSPDDLVLALRATRDADAVLLADMAARGLFFPPEQGGRFGVSASLSAPPRPSRRSADLVPHDRALADDLAAALERWPLVPCARVVAAHKMVTADLRRPAIAIDAGKVHHELMTGWGRAAQEGKLLVDRKPDRAELFLPGSENRPATLSLPLDGESLSQAFVEAIKEWRSFLGLRHWIALQALFSIQGKREGRVLWKLDEHLNALGVSKRWREDPENRASVVREVSLLTKMQLVVYRPDGTVRARHNVLVTTAEIDVERGGEWQLEGLELQMHPWLYNGVRDQKTGQLGKHWHPVPPELAKVDHDKFRHALVLGLMLPIRWKWIWAHQGVDHIQIEARKLLDLACIDLSPINPGRAWKALERSLAELERINLLGHVEWSGEPHTLAAQVRLYPADWLLDRTLQGLRPIEQTLPAALPTTGDELIAWRKDRGFTQRELARRLGVGLRTVKRDEVAKDKALGRTIAIALKALSNRPGETPQPPAVDPEPEPGEPPPPSS